MKKSVFTIRLIAAEKFLRGLLLMIVGFKLLSMLGDDVHQHAVDFVNRHGINMANRFVQMGLGKLTGIGDKQMEEYGIIAVLYSLLLMVEGTGLWMSYLWAEYVTIISTTLLLPLEIYELVEKFTYVRLALLLVNIAIVVYLIIRVRKDRKEAKPA
ncbi:MAG: DUF2127 domain-containing protein [Pyrinomonadaceae bacterium]